MVVIWVDISSNKIWLAVFVNWDLEDSKQMGLGNNRVSHMEKMDEFKDILLDYFEIWSPDIVATEDPASLARINAEACRTLSWYQWVVISLCYKKDIFYHMISPKQWKKFSIDEANVKKSEIPEKMKNAFKITHDLWPDEADAIGIWFSAYFMFK